MGLRIQSTQTCVRKKEGKILYLRRATSVRALPLETKEQAQVFQPPPCEALLLKGFCLTCWSEVELMVRSSVPSSKAGQ